LTQLHRWRKTSGHNLIALLRQTTVSIYSQ